MVYTNNPDKASYPHKVRSIAFYLPQFHPIPENDKWWGKGFTEWTNVGKAKPLFKGHYQPRVPADLGYYDLRLPEVREAQAQMARDSGIEGFCYWHYWFGNGKRLLERPFDEVLESGKPNFPFCLAWANESWSGIWHGQTEEVLMEQSYLGEQDYEMHYQFVRKAFFDERYISVEGKPIFLIYRPMYMPDLKNFISLWNKYAQKDGFKGIHFVGMSIHVAREKDYLLQSGINAILCNRLSEACLKETSLVYRTYYRKFQGLRVYDYRNIMSHLIGSEEYSKEFYPTAFPNWDHSPRSGKKSLIIKNSQPALFAKHLEEVIKRLEGKDPENRIVFIKSWNEWAEGNYLEPDLRFGHGYLDAIKKVFQ